MHSVCLGLMRKLTKYWFCTIGNIGKRLKHDINKHIMECIPFIPHFFQRKPRKVDELLYWKATEYRLILLYTGIIIIINNYNVNLNIFHTYRFCDSQGFII